MDFRHIKAFIAVADTLSVTKAAERLHISQPPLSRHIHQLEEELGVMLFVRHRHGVTLTDDGRRLLDKARALDAAGSDFCETARQMTRGQHDRIRIGIGWGLWDVVNRLRVEFTRLQPGVTFEVKDVYCADDCLEQLRSASLDVVLSRPPFDESVLEVAPIYNERIQAVISDASPLAARDAVSVRDLADMPLLLWERHMSPALYDRVLKLYERERLSTPMIPTPGAGPWNHAGLMLVASGQGVYLCLGVPHSSPQPASGVAVRPVSDPGATIEVCAVSRRGQQSQLVHQFIECVWHVYPQPRRVAVDRHVAALGA
jgi:DNA-binding transcriptional LysR family regulator